MCFIPAPEKMGSFCPRMRVDMASIEEIPVWMKFLGYSLETGFMGEPLTSLLAEEYISPRPSLGFPAPLKTRPSISGARVISMGRAVKMRRVSLSEIPDVPSKTCTTALSPASSTTRPTRSSPEAVYILTTSSFATPSTPSRAMREPLISLSPMCSVIKKSTSLMFSVWSGLQRPQLRRFLR